MAAPSGRSTRPPRGMARNGTKATMMVTMTSRLTTILETGIGMTIAVSPRTRAMFMMLEPMTLPTAISPCPLVADAIEAASSGALVPNPTTVTPITKGETPILRARRAAPRTRSSAPKIRMPIDRMRMSRSRVMGCGNPTGGHDRARPSHRSRSCSL